MTLKMKKYPTLWVYGIPRGSIRNWNTTVYEVKITQGKTFITDSENLELVNKYPLQAKAKKERNGPTRFYVMYQVKKKVNKFPDLRGVVFISISFLIILPMLLKIFL